MMIGERVRLRAIELDDLPRYVDWLNDPDVQRGIERHLPLSLAEEQSWFGAMMAGPPAERSLAIEVQEGQGWRHIGGIGLMRLDPVAHQAEVGLHIGDRSCWGKGYGAEAMRLMMRHAFDTLNLDRLYLRVYEENHRAHDLYRRLGVQEEGRLRQGHYRDGRYWDTIWMGILCAEWKGKEGER